MSIPADLARPLDPAKPQDIRLNLNAKQIAAVNKLYATGFWGNSPKQTVAQIFDAALRKIDLLK